MGHTNSPTDAGRTPSPGRGGTASTLSATDGHQLALRRFGGGPEPVGRIVVAGATGVPQGFYRRFAEHAAGRGFDVVTFDYRGIGASAPANLRGFRMDYRDWGRLDLAAVVTEVADSGDVFLVGHSYGGQALGLLPDPSPVRAAYVLGSGSGWTGWMPRLERVRVRLLWGVVGPVVTRWAGYLAWSRLGMGEDLPLDVYRQWKRWCRYPHYFFDDPLVREEIQESFDRVRTPIVAANSVDDPWIPPAARDAFMVGYRNAAVTPVDLEPYELGLKTLGHMGYFRQGAEPLWDKVLDVFGGALPRRP
jgi:predicted alpha/beta hydrolase